MVAISGTINLNSENSYLYPSPPAIIKLPSVPIINISIPIAFKIPPIVFSSLYVEVSFLGSGNELLKVAPQLKHFPDAF